MDHRADRGLQQQGGLAYVFGQILPFGEEGSYVAACAEIRAAASQQHDTHSPVAVTTQKCRLQILQRWDVQTIRRFGPIQVQMGDAVLQMEQYGPRPDQYLLHAHRLALRSGRKG
ncbi:hypothetical protein D3C78_1474320 [compost metagenome]